MLKFDIVGGGTAWIVASQVAAIEAVQGHVALILASGKQFEVVENDSAKIMRRIANQLAKEVGSTTPEGRARASVGAAAH